MKIYLYGCGHRCDILLSLLQNTDIVVGGIIDSNPMQWGKRKGEYLIESPVKLLEESNFFVCITFFGENDYEPLWEELSVKYAIRKERVLSFHDVIRIVYSSYIFEPHISKETKRCKYIFAGAWNFGIGGVETWLCDTVEELVKRNDDIYMITNKNQIDLGCKNNHIIDYHIEKSCNFLMDDVRNSIKCLSNNMPCTVICSRADEILLAAYLLKKAFPDKIRIISVVHGAADGLIRDISSYREAIDYYLCVSQAVFSAISKMGISSDMCSMIKSPIKMQKVERRDYSECKDVPIRLGYVGRLEVFHKRADLLIELIKELEKQKVFYEFEIAGEGSFAPQIVEYLDNASIQGKVSYMGKIDRENIRAFWLKKDIAINVSDSEGRPISNIEAMLCGVVPVVTATAGIQEDVINERTGYLVDIGDCASMAKKIAYLEKNRSVLKTMGKNAIEKVACDIDVEEYTRCWIELLNS